MKNWSVVSNPIGSMYGIYANIWGIFIANVTTYSIHGSYGNEWFMISSSKLAKKMGIQRTSKFPPFQQGDLIWPTSMADMALCGLAVLSQLQGASSRWKSTPERADNVWGVLFFKPRVFQLMWQTQQETSNFRLFVPPILSKLWMVYSWTYHFLHESALLLVI